MRIVYSKVAPPQQPSIFKLNPQVLTLKTSSIQISCLLSKVIVKFIEFNLLVSNENMYRMKDRDDLGQESTQSVPQGCHGRLKLVWWINWRDIYCCKTIFFLQIGHFLESEKPSNGNLDRGRWVDDSNFWRFSIGQTNNVENSLISCLERLWLTLGFTEFWLAIDDLVI